MRGLIDQTLAAYGRIDILVNNAGAVARELTHELSVESWETAMGIMGEWYSGYRFDHATGRRCVDTPAVPRFRPELCLDVIRLSSAPMALSMGINAAANWPWS